MAQRIAYTGAPVLTAQDIAAWRRNDAVLLEAALLNDIIIPGVTAQAEARSNDGRNDQSNDESHDAIASCQQWRPSHPKRPTRAHP